MLEQLKDLPKNVVGFRASGKIDKRDYDTVLIPAVARLADTAGAINYIFVLDTGISNFSLGAILDDLKTGLHYFFKWRKIAVVSDEDGVNNFTNIVGHIMHGEVKAYHTNQLEEAKKWIAE